MSQLGNAQTDELLFFSVTPTHLNSFCADTKPTIYVLEELFGEEE